MKKDLAESLLAKIMGWSDAEKAIERARLESFAAYKYDEYQQFAPGRRFIESLALWLAQFDKGNERLIAYQFVRDRLMFISADEIHHLVELTFPTVIRPILIKDTAAALNVSAEQIKGLVATREYRSRLRRTLVLGLSDGARTDGFRRANPNGMSNEQVFHAYDVSHTKAGDMVDNLRKDLTQILERAPTDQEAKFQYVVLLDDFSASGTSFIRQTPEGVWEAKIPKIIASLDQSETLGNAVADSGVVVMIVLYVAADQACQYIEERLKTLTFSKGEIRFTVVHKLGAGARLDDVADAAILDLVRQDRYFDDSVDDEHAKVGGTSKRYGYAEGRLPLVLGHNTPNNSIFLLWAEDMQRVRGLFPRVSRHRKLQ